MTDTPDAAWLAEFIATERDEKIAELEAALADNDLYVKTWSENYDKMQSLLLDAYTVLAFAFNRIHALPRSQDTELADDIAALRARIAQMIDTKGLK